MIYHYAVDGLPVTTGDIICTMNGKPDILPGEFWRLVGRLVPGDVDHVAVYLGPGGRCAEAGSRGVITFEMHEGRWDAEYMTRARGLLIDTFYGVAYPFSSVELSRDEEACLRQEVAAYCLAQVGKPYNLNFLDPEKEQAFYCSQLVYKACLRAGLNLNTGLAMEQLPGTNRIIYPQEIWSGCPHRRAGTVPQVDRAQAGTPA